MFLNRSFVPYQSRHENHLQQFNDDHIVQTSVLYSSPTEFAFGRRGELNKNHQCEICTKSFSLKHHLTEHMRTHTGEKPFKCDICHKRFAQAGTRNFHKKKTHCVKKNGAPTAFQSLSSPPIVELLRNELTM